MVPDDVFAIWKSFVRKVPQEPWNILRRMIWRSKLLTTPGVPACTFGEDSMTAPPLDSREKATRYQVMMLGRMYIFDPESPLGKLRETTSMETFLVDVQYDPSITIQIW